jgi:hypothetical protein
MSRDVARNATPAAGLRQAMHASAVHIH